MATNGDFANNVGLFTPVSTNADLRDGYSQINLLADRAAWIAGANAWGLGTGTTIALATGWSTQTDPNGASAGTLNGGIKQLGPLMVAISLRVTYTGATLTAATAGGNIADTKIGNVYAAGFAPNAPRYIKLSTGTFDGSVRVDADGQFYLTDMSSGAVLSSGTVCQLDGIYVR